MNRYALLKDSINDSIFGVVVDSNGLSKFHGVSAKGIEWSKWANGISVKSENSGLPIGVVVGGYSTLRNTNPNYVQALVDTVSLRNPSINKKQGISDSLIKNSSSIVPNVRDAELRAFDIDKRNEAIAFKARAFRTDSKVSSLLTQVRAERLGFVSAEGVFSSRNPIHTPEVKQAEIIDSYGRSLQRAIGLSLIRKKSVKMLAVVRKDQALAQSFGLEVKAAGIGPKIGSRLSGGLRAAPAGMSFVDVTGVTDADTDGIVFEGKPGLERPIIPRFMVPKELARKLSGIVEGDAEAIEKQRRAGNTSVQFDEGKLRNIIASVGGDASLLQAVTNDRGVPATTTSGRERVSVAARNVAGNIGSRRREIASRRGMRSRNDYDSSLSRNGWTKNGDKWNKGNWELEVLVDENDRGNRLVARNKEIGETLEQERGPDVGALKHLNVFESILRGSDDAGFDDDGGMRSRSEWTPTRDGIEMDAPDIDGIYEIQGNNKEGFVVTRYSDGVRNGGQNQQEYEHDEIFKSRAAAKKWAERDYNDAVNAEQNEGRGMRSRTGGGKWDGERPEPKDIKPGADLSGANLSGMDLRDVDLQGADLAGADLSEANLMRANLRNAYLANANLRLAVLDEADLSFAKLNRSILVNAQLSNAQMGGADLSFADLRAANFSDANLAEADLTNANLSYAFLADADMSGATLHNANLYSANLNDTNLQGALLRGANMDKGWEQQVGMRSRSGGDDSDEGIQFEAESAAQSAWDNLNETTKYAMVDEYARSRGANPDGNDWDPNEWEPYVMERWMDDYISDFIDDPDGAKEYYGGMRSRSDYDSSLSRNGWTKNGDKWNKGNWELEVLVDENDRGNRLVARNKEIGETLEQERGPDVGALKHLNVFESILRGSDDAGFDDSAMRAPGGVRRATRRAMAGRRSRNERGMRSRSDDPTLEVEEKLSEFLTPNEVGNVMYNGVETLSGTKRSRAEKIINDVMRSRSDEMRAPGGVRRAMRRAMAGRRSRNERGMRSRTEPLVEAERLNGNELSDAQQSQLDEAALDSRMLDLNTLNEGGIDYDWIMDALNYNFYNAQVNDDLAADIEKLMVERDEKGQDPETRSAGFAKDNARSVIKHWQDSVDDDPDKMGDLLSSYEGDLVAAMEDHYDDYLNGQLDTFENRRDGGMRSRSIKLRSDVTGAEEDIENEFDKWEKNFKKQYKNGRQAEYGLQDLLVELNEAVNESATNNDDYERLIDFIDSIAKFVRSDIEDFLGSRFNDDDDDEEFDDDDYDYDALASGERQGMRSRSGGMRARTLTDEQVTNITNRLNALESARESGDKEAQKELLKKMFQGKEYVKRGEGFLLGKEGDRYSADKEITDEDLYDFLKTRYISDAQDDLAESFADRTGSYISGGDIPDWLESDEIDSAPLYDRAIEILDEENDGTFEMPQTFEELAAILKSEDFLSHQLDRQIRLRKNRLKTNEKNLKWNEENGMRSRRYRNDDDSDYGDDDYGVDRGDWDDDLDPDERRRIMDGMRSSSGGMRLRFGMNSPRDRNVFFNHVSPGGKDMQKWSGTAEMRDVVYPKRDYTGAEDVSYSDKIILSAPSDGGAPEGKVYIAEFDEKTGRITVRWGKADSRNLQTKIYSGKTEEDFHKLLEGKEKRGYRLEGGRIPAKDSSDGNDQNWTADYEKQIKMGMRSSTGTERRPHLNVRVTGSSALRQASFNEEKDELVVTYANGKTYTYENVSHDDLDDILSGPDRILTGAAINEVKKKYDFREGGTHTFDPQYQDVQGPGGEFSVENLSRIGRREKTQIPVSGSSAIEALTWDDDKKDLIVTYAGGRTYTYKDVDSYWIEDLERETGTGRIINNIKKEGYRVVDGGEHGEMPSEGLTAERAEFGMRSRMAPSSGRIRAAEMEISARPQGMASRRSEGLRDPRFAVPGRDRVDPSDGQLWNRLSDEEKETVANRAVNREKMLLNEFKQRFPRWWDRASKEADKKGWDKDLMKGGNAGWLDELHRFVTKLADDPNYPEKSRADAEKQFNDLQALFNMRVNRGSHDLLEHLNPTSRRYLFDDARRDDSKKTGISASGKEMKTPSTAPRPFGEPIDVGTPIREQVGQSQKKPLKERLDSYYKRMSDKILYTDPARQARREMRKARRQGINAGGFTESEANPVDDAKRKIRRRKRIKQMRKNRTRDIGSISDSSTGNRVDGRLAHTDSQGSLVLGDKLTSTLATMMANYRTESKLKKTKGSVNKNRALAVLWDGAGYNGTPHVVTAEEFKALHAAGWVPVVRGHGKGSNGVRYANDWIDDPVRFITGQGGEAQGEGEYWARPNQGGHNWFSWMDGSLPAGTVGLLPPSTRRVSLSELGKIKSEHAPLAKSIKAFDAGLPSGEREKMDAEEYVTQLRDHLRSSLGPIYESTMSTKMGQMTSKILESLSGSSDSKKQELLDSLEFLELISRQRTSNSYAPLLGYDTIMADSGVELIHNRTAITVVGDTFTRDDAVNLAKSKA